MKRAKQNRDKVVTMPFHYLNRTALSAGALTIPVSPATFPRVLEVADAFDMYRLKSLRFRICPSLSQVSDSSAGFYPGVTDNPPTATSDVMENINSVFHGGLGASSGSTPSTEWCSIAKADLHGYADWYKTIVGSPDTSAEIMGNIYVRGNAAETVAVEIRGEFQFAGPANTGATPAERRELAALREKHRLMTILAYCPNSKDLSSATLPTNRRRDP